MEMTEKFVKTASKYNTFVRSLKWWNAGCSGSKWNKSDLEEFRVKVEEPLEEAFRDMEPAEQEIFLAYRAVARLFDNGEIVIGADPEERTPQEKAKYLEQRLRSIR